QNPPPAPPTRPAGPARPTPLASIQNRTLRMTGRIAIGGRRFRLRLTNAYGNAPVSLAAVHAAIQQDGPAIESGSDRAVLFDGKPTVTLPPGVEWLSDPFDMPATALTHFAVS